MKPKTVMLLIVPALCGLVAAVVVHVAFQPVAGPEMVVLPVAAVDLPIGTLLKDVDTQLVLKAYPRDLVPTLAVANPAELKGKKLARSVEKNMPITPKDLSSSESLLDGLPDGFRAVTIKVDQVTANAGFIVPGSRVDLLCTLQDSTRPGVYKTRAFLQNVQVVAVNATDRPPEGSAVVNNPSTVTLAVRLHDVQRVLWAKERGSVGVALRKPGDEGFVPVHEVTGADGGDDPLAEPSNTVEVLLARRNIPAGTIVDNVDELFVKASYPANLAVGAVLAEKRESLRGMAVAQFLVANYPATRAHFAVVPQGEVFILTIMEGAKPPVFVRFVNGRQASRSDVP